MGIGSKYRQKYYRNQLYLGIGPNTIGGTELIKEPSKLYQQIKLSMAGKTGDPTPMNMLKMNMFALCNFDDPDIMLLFLCNPDVLKYTSDAMTYTL